MGVRIKHILSIIVSFYIFILGIELIQHSIFYLSESFVQTTITTFSSPMKAFGAGWLASSIVQSGGAVASISLIMLGSGALTLGAVIYIFFGAILGRGVTGQIVSLLTKSRNKRDFRHGFEIALANNIYITSLILIFIPLEYFFHLFSKIGTSLTQGFSGVELTRFINFTDIITQPIIEPLFRYNYYWVFLVAGFCIFILSLELLTKSALLFLGGHEHGRRIIKKYLGSPWKAFCIGLFITLLFTSTNITITLLVPLAAARVVKLKEALPYLIGANIGTVTEVLLAGLIVGKPAAIAAILVYLLFPIIGAIIWMPNLKLLHRITKGISKHMLHISKPRAAMYIAIFFIIPLVMIAL